MLRIVLVAGSLSFACGVRAGELDGEPHAGLAEFFALHCMECHGNAFAEGDMNIERALQMRPLVRNLDLWRNVLMRLSNEEMPPPDSVQPSADERAQAIALLDEAVNQFDYSHIHYPGYEPIRRLTHEEYSRTVSDLFDIELRPAEKLRFPTDLSGTSGFDNSANTLFIQPILMEKYVLAAEDVVATALPGEPQTPEHARVRARVFISRPDDATSPETAAREILKRFLLRAFRRSVAAEQTQQFMDHFQHAREAGSDFDDAIRATLRAVLISPYFLLHIETHHKTDDAYRISDWELASRLSYFLWASMPDDKLFELAAAGKLHEPQVLESQIKRMLADPRAESLGSIMAAQWLGFGHVGTRVRPDAISHPWATDAMLTAMREESAEFFAHLVREDRPIHELVTADYTFLNETLAGHYGIDDVRGEQLRRVAWEDPHRGGIFGQAGLLMVTSYPGRTSPVLRGNWILDRVLGTPPPPPPPNAGELDEEIRRRENLSVREKLELHRSNKTCNACHEQMDPLGFSLENLDQFGRWRDNYEDEDAPIDATGRLPSGTSFAGPEGLKRVISSERLDDLVRQTIRKTLSYALGRQLEYYDEPAVQKIGAVLEQNGYRFQTLIHEVVLSYPFQYKQNRPPHE